MTEGEGCSSIQEVLTILIKEPNNMFTLKSRSTDKHIYDNGYRMLKILFSEEDNQTKGCVTLQSLTSSKVELELISNLNLSHCNLYFLPISFSALKNLKQLVLSHNKLKEIPRCLGSGLYFIEILDLSFNFICDFETEPKCYKRLKSLRINDNLLTTIPEWILYVRCFNLEELIYSYNQIQHLASSRFNTSCNYRLKKLEMLNCNIINEDIKFISQIKTLEELNLSNDKTKNALNSLTKEDQLFKNDTCSWTQKLQVLKLNGLNLSILSDNIVNLTHLRVLELQENHLMWLPDNITKLVNLEELDISHNKITHLPPDLNVLQNLRVLKVQYNIMSSIPDLHDMIKLNYVDFYHNHLETCDVNIDSIECIDLEMNYVDTPKFLNVSEYSRKKLLLRQKDQLPRFDGKRECLCDYNVQSEDSSECDEENDEEEYCNEGKLSDCYNKDEEEEQWDEIVPVQTEYKRLCTLSDDEWQGYDMSSVKIESVTNNRLQRPVLQIPFIFCDAEE